MKYALISDLHSHYEHTKLVLEHIKDVANDAKIIGLGDLYECKIGKKKAKSKRNCPLNEATDLNEAFNNLLTFPSIRGNQEERIALVTGNDSFLSYPEQMMIEHATLLHGHQFKWSEDWDPTFPKIDTPLLFFGHSHRAAIYIQNERVKIDYNEPMEVKNKSLQINVGSVVDTCDWCLYNSDEMTITFMRAKNL